MQGFPQSPIKKNSIFIEIVFITKSIDLNILTKQVDISISQKY